MSTQYSIAVKNSSGIPANIAVLQKLPNTKDAFSLIWFSKSINNTNTETFKWNIDWGLNWGTTDAPLADGVSYTSAGEMVKVDPNSSTAVNNIAITYQNEDFMTGKQTHENLGPSKLQIMTDSSFTVKQSENMAVAVYMDGKPALAMKGLPNGNYTFDTHPTYYICVTAKERGEAVDGSFMSKAYQVEFSDTTAVSLALNETLNFNPA